PSQEIAIRISDKRTSRHLAQAAMREIDDITGTLEVDVNGISFESIGGQAKAKEEVEELAFAVSHPELYKKWGTDPPKGILLHGPSGTGKTLLAMALVTEAEARFLHVKTSDIGS